MGVVVVTGEAARMEPGVVVVVLRERERVLLVETLWE